MTFEWTSMIVFFQNLRMVYFPRNGRILSAVTVWFTCYPTLSINYNNWVINWISEAHSLPRMSNLRVVQREVRNKNFEVRFSAMWLRFQDDSHLDRLKIDWRWRHSIFESGYVGAATLRDWFQKRNGFPSELPLIHT